MREIVSSVEAEFRRYQVLGQGVLDQLCDDELCWRPLDSQNSVAIIVWHVSGNLNSRFSDFLTSDGEKPWRDRESEFTAREVSRPQLLVKWDDGWNTLFHNLSGLTDDKLLDSIRIRRQELTVHHALCRSLSHTSYHVGQMVYIGKQLRGSSWKHLSIPPGGSENYNRNPTKERGPSRD